jgi:hypothetical protein
MIPSTMIALRLLAYTPFVQPMPGLWQHWQWLALPLCLGVSIVWKSIKCAQMRSVPREAALIFVFILAGLLALAAALAVVDKIVQ